MSECAHTPEEAAADVLATACKAIADMDLTRVNRIAATLLRSVERDIGRTLRHEADRHQHRTTNDHDDLHASVGIEGAFESVAYLALEVESVVGHARGAGCPVSRSRRQGHHRGVRSFHNNQGVV